MTRHFNVVAFVDLEPDSLKRIYQTIFGNFLKANCSEALQSLCDPIVEASLKIYNVIRSELLPTPIKSHYTYNLRDLSKVFNGILSADPRNLVYIFKGSCS